MQKKTKKAIADTAITLVILTVTFFISMLLQNVLEIDEHITTLFVFSVFIISLLTDGFIYGLIATPIGVIAINYAFTSPYFHMDFSVKESIFSAIVMLIISFLTSALTTKLKAWQALKAETEAERLRANLLRAVSHDLRTPLTTIYGASSSIVESYDKLSDAQRLRMASSIKEDAQWLIRMVENLLSVTRIDSGSVHLIKSPTVLEELIDSVILKFKKRYPTRSIDADIPDTLLLIPMDPMLIEQVIFNILENAEQHAKGFTKLSLRVFTSDGNAVFEIADNGCGIAKERLDGLFLGYAGKLADSSDSGKRNLGIGLSVCATIVKAHGGSISAENAKSGGAIFRFSLPLEEVSHEQ
jgi:two-component system sensor histidine kinase KdpD